MKSQKVRTTSIVGRCAVVLSQTLFQHVMNDFYTQKLFFKCCSLFLVAIFDQVTTWSNMSQIQFWSHNSSLMYTVTVYKIRNLMKTVQ